MFKGGIADKLGNRYEAKWLVRQLFRVIYGERDWLRFEGITSAFGGFEFAVGHGDATEWHQTKKAASNGSWGIGALKREGVLEAFRKRFSSSDKDTCCFISEDPAKAIQILSQKADVANDLAEFEGGLAKDQAAAFTDLCEAWNEDKETSWQWLRRSSFQVESTSELDSHLDIIAHYAFVSSDGQSAFEALRDYMEQRFNVVVSTETLRQDLRSHQHLEFKDWALNPTLKERIRQETASYLETYSPFGAGGETIDRKEAKQVFDALLDTRAPRVMLITGVAGSGKSGVVRQLISLLADAEVPHLAFRVDHHLACNRPTDFGEAVLGRRELPTVTLKGIAPQQQSVLIIDQVDAVSEVSGRNGAVRNALLQLLDGLSALRTVKIVFICRNYDFDNDPRLKRLRDEQFENRFDVPLLDWVSEITPLIEAKGKDPEQFTPAQRELLRLPLNLAVYMEVADDPLTFASRDDLFRALVRKKDRALRRDRGVSWSLMQVMTALADWMSSRQRLEAPVSVLDDFPEAEDILCSEGMIVSSRKHVNFFHESFFDFAYAQAFAKSSQSLHEMLLSSEQHLFRRTQCRQILEVMRQQDMARYLDALSTVLLKEDVRFHIRLAIAQWLGTLPDPSAAEREIVLTLDRPSEPFPKLVESAAFGSAGWFDLHTEAGWLQELLNDPIQQRRNVPFWLLIETASKRPNQVAKIFRDWWKGDPERASTLLHWLGNFRRAEPHAALEQLCVDVIRSNPRGLFAEDSVDHREMLLVTWVEENSGRGAPILKAFFDAWFEAYPEAHPFDRNNIKRLDLHAMGKLSEKAPAEFLDAVFAGFVESLRIISDRRENGEWDGTFGTPYKSPALIDDDHFLALVRKALTKTAELNPPKAEEMLCRLPLDLHSICLHLHLHTILGNPKALKDHFLSLLPEPELFDAGWHGAEWLSFAEAAKAVFPFLDDTEKARAEQAVLRQRSNYNYAVSRAQDLRGCSPDEGRETRKYIIYRLNRSGFNRWCILNTIGEEQLTKGGQRQLEMLNRKFSDARMPTPATMEGYTVGSPIKFDHAEKMSNKNWLSAISEYSTEQEFPRGPDGGGPHELGQVLKKCAKDDLPRFVDLLQHIPDTAPPPYITNILWAIVESDDVPDDVARAAILNAHERDGQPYGEDIARIVSSLPHLAEEDDIFEIVMFYAEFGTAEELAESEQQRVDRETASIKELMEFGQSLHISGVNGARGEAVEALEYVLWKVPKRTEAIWELVTRRVENEPLLSVRCSLMRPLSPLYNRDRKNCGELVERLVSAYSRDGSPLNEPAADELMPLATRHGINLMQYLLYGAPAAARRLISLLRISDNEMLQAVGAFHVLRASFMLEEFQAEADRVIETRATYRVMAAEIACRFVSIAEFPDRVSNLVLQYFNDDEEDVRQKAASIFSHADPTEPEKAQLFISAYLESKNFDGDDYHFFDFLKRTTIPISDFLIIAAEKLISEKTNKPNQNWGYRDFRYLHELIQAEYTASEHSPDLRRRLLDIIDKCLMHGIYGTDAILKAHDRAA